MRELDARPEEITDLDALHDLLMQVRQRRPNAEGVLPDNGQVFLFRNWILWEIPLVF